MLPNLGQKQPLCFHHFFCNFDDKTHQASPSTYYATPYAEASGNLSLELMRAIQWSSSETYFKMVSCVGFP